MPLGARASGPPVAVVVAETRRWHPRMAYVTQRELRRNPTQRKVRAVWQTKALQGQAQDKLSRTIPHGGLQTPAATRSRCRRANAPIVHGEADEPDPNRDADVGGWATWLAASHRNFSPSELTTNAPAVLAQATDRAEPMAYPAAKTFSFPDPKAGGPSEARKVEILGLGGLVAEPGPGSGPSPRGRTPPQQVSLAGEGTLRRQRGAVVLSLEPTSLGRSLVLAMRRRQHGEHQCAGGKDNPETALKKAGRRADEDTITTLYWKLAAGRGTRRPNDARPGRGTGHGVRLHYAVRDVKDEMTSHHSHTHARLALRLGDQQTLQPQARNLVLTRWRWAIELLHDAACALLRSGPPAARSAAHHRASRHVEDAAGEGICKGSVSHRARAGERLNAVGEDAAPDPASRPQAGGVPAEFTA
ncbi:hypothetical protein G7Z17_g967 [Cylindrodendrum hubeiense]|uniref:Uncharacterized protein n=1 Tax=Cylindrodendrum hubeiense TaxID=595255 RepID=A0A9P5HR37_9HYPO|nr:hypothetical protein G7Z17_g967 [Cylindrodendrum hubeiense]